MPSYYNKEYVLMPWEDTTNIIHPQPSGDATISSRWELIANRLNNHIDSTDHLIEAIRSYNVQFNSDGTQSTPAWSFRLLRETIQGMSTMQRDMFFMDGGVLDTMRSLVLATQDQCPKVVWLSTGCENNFSLHQLQVACILSNAFFCTFPKRCKNQPSINFNSLFEGSKAGASCRAKEKLKCLFNYFFRIHSKPPIGYLSFHRRCIPQHEFPRWHQTTVPLTSVVAYTAGCIEDQEGHLQMDFANRIIGGGVLGWGCVQEEIRFVICPELIATRLFTEAMADNEALLVIGAERYCSYSGYADSFQFTGDYEDTTPFDRNERRKTHILAVDALRFTQPQEQYRESRILREIKKIYTGLRPISRDEPLPLATGNWGCGVFRGDPQLKSLLQMMAASQAGRKVAYFTFGDEELKNAIMKTYSLLRDKNITVGLLYRTLTRYLKDRRKGQTVFQFVRESISARGCTDLLSFLNQEEIAVMEGGQKRKEEGRASSEKKQFRSDVERDKISPRLWIEREKTKTDSESGHQSTSNPSFRNNVVKSDNNKEPEKLCGRISPSMFSDSELENTDDIVPCTPGEEQSFNGLLFRKPKNGPTKTSNFFEAMYGPSTSTDRFTANSVGLCPEKESCDQESHVQQNLEAASFSTVQFNSLNGINHNCDTIPEEKMDTAAVTTAPELEKSKADEVVSGLTSPYFPSPPSDLMKRYSQSRIDSYFKK